MSIMLQFSLTHLRLFTVSLVRVSNVLSAGTILTTPRTSWLCASGQAAMAFLQQFQEAEVAGAEQSILLSATWEGWVLFLTCILMEGPCVSLWRPMGQLRYSKSLKQSEQTLFWWKLSLH